MKIDFLVQYDLEKYIFDIVRKEFMEKGFLTAYDFFCIIVWKANRSKTRIAKKLLKHSKLDNLDEAVYFLTSGISEIPEPKEKLRHLMKDWNLKLPTATAILTALYPEEFTVYDVRVCDELNDFHKLNNVVNFENIWSGYLEYKQKIEQAAPADLSIRDKDRYLLGKSFSKQLRDGIKNGFGNSNSKSMEKNR